MCFCGDLFELQTIVRPIQEEKHRYIKDLNINPNPQIIITSKVLNTFACQDCLKKLSNFKGEIDNRQSYNV